MIDPVRHRTSALALFAIAAVAVALIAATNPVAADTSSQPHAVTAWAQRNAHPLTSTDPTTGLDDLAPLRQSVGDASVVGLGESAHGAAEETTLKHRTLRMLVEQLGFRSIAWEEDWTTGLEINSYVHGGPQDLDQLMADVSPQYQTQEVADVLAWLRSFNTGRSDQVSFVGIEYYFTRNIAYDVVDDYVASTAPDRLEDLRRHLDELRPTSSEPFENIERYKAVENQQRYIDHAHAVYDLLEDLPPEGNHDIALHAARQIVSWHEHYAMEDADSLIYREARAAESLRWWQDRTGDDILYWAASPHTANAPRLRIVLPGWGEWRFPSTGSYLRSWYGDQYLSIGFTLDHGAVSTGGGETEDLAPPPAEWFEAPLGDVDHAVFSLDLRGQTPTPVGRWLDRPAVTRGPPQAGSGAYTDGGTLRDWFDVLVHTQVVHPAAD